MSLFVYFMGSGTPTSIIVIMTTAITILQQSAERTFPAMGNQRPLALANFINMAATIGFAFLGHHLGSRFGTTGAVEGFILGVAAGNLGGHLVVQASLAMRGISIYRQDFLYTALLAIVFACGVIVPRALGPIMSPRAAHALAVVALDVRRDELLGAHAGVVAQQLLKRLGHRGDARGGQPEARDDPAVLAGALDLVGAEAGHGAMLPERDAAR